MVSRRIGLLAGGIATVLALAGCTGGGGEGAEETPETSGTYTIYANLPLTGGIAVSTKLVQSSINVTVEDINANGGIGGREVVVIYQDDQLDTTRALTLLQEQLDQARPDFVITGGTSNEALALLPLLSREGILSSQLAQSSAINDPALYPYVFIPYVESTADAAALLSKIEDEGYETVALLTANDANGQSARDGLTAAFTDAGLEVVGEEYTPTDVDMTAQMQRLEAQNPDVLIIQAFGAAAAHILESRTKLGWDIPTLGHSSIGLGQNLADISGPDDWNNLELGVFHVTAGQPQNQDVYDEYIAKVIEENDGITQSVHFATLYWDLLHILKAAVEQADSVEADDVKAALEDLEITEELAVQLLTFPTEYSSWSPDSHFFEIPGDKVFTYVAPGPLVNGVIESE